MNDIQKQIEAQNRIKFNFNGGRYVILQHSIKDRLRCYLTHIPFTRRRFPQFHDLSCGAGIIARIDHVRAATIQDMIDDDAFDVKINKANGEK